MKFITIRNVALLLLAALLTGLGLIIDEVAEGDTLRFDQAFLLALREPGDPTNPIGPVWLEEVARDITALGGVAVLTLLTTLVAAHFLLRGKPRSALFVALAAITGTMVSNILKGIFDRPRPELTAIMEYGRGSFPSGHSTMSAVVYLTLGVMLATAAKELKLKVFYVAIAIVVIALVGLSRLYLGVHYPTDVAAGWAIGASWAILWAIAAS
ncbi:MAG: phosphatase PAP2 family protein, partial [Devosia sp.]